MQQSAERAKPEKHKNARLANREKRHVFPEIALEALAGPGRLHAIPREFSIIPDCATVLRPSAMPLAFWSVHPRLQGRSVAGPNQRSIPSFPAEHVPRSDRPDKWAWSSAMACGLWLSSPMAASLGDILALEPDLGCASAGRRPWYLATCTLALS